MKTNIILFILYIFVHVLSADDFIRNLPDKSFSSKITAEKFKGMDAVIILKEQSFNISNAETRYRGFDIEGYNIVQTNILIVKVFNEVGVKRYGSFEYEFREYYGDEIQSAYIARARVLKPDGKIFEMDEDEVKLIDSRTNNSGDPTYRKIIFKIPNVANNDVIQIEWQVNNPLVATYAKQFYYNAQDFILFSNLYITLPWKFDASYLNFPQNVIGQPKIKQISQEFGAGKTYFWSVRNLNPMPNEPFSRPFEDRSLMTAFYSKEGNYSTWNKIAENFTEQYIEGKALSSTELKKLDLYKDLPSNSKKLTVIDTLYTVMREHFNILSNNVIYTSKKSIKKLLKTGKGNATDMAYLMYQILNKKEIPVNIVLIRDKRDGIYEESVPYLYWFDRLGVLVKIGNEEKLYDFDRSIAYNYEIPWYLKSTKVAVLGKNWIHHQWINTDNSVNTNIINETHTISLDSSLTMKDSINCYLTGAPAERFRYSHYSDNVRDLSDVLNKTYHYYCLSTIDTTIVNDYLRYGDIHYSLAGNSKKHLIYFDNFLKFNLTNKCLSEFKNKIYSTVRYSAVKFDGPFKISLNWNFEIPQGYQPRKEDLKNLKIDGPNNCYSLISYSISNSKLIVFCNIFFLSEEIPVTAYSALIKLLDDTQAEINKDILLKKI